MRAIAISVLTLLLPGCVLFAPKFETPKLSIVHVSLVKSDLWEQQLKVRMRVQNPNDRRLPIRGLAYTLEVDGQEFARGESGASFVVPALGEAEFDMNVTANMAGTLIKFLGRGSELGRPLEYRLSGKIALSEGWLRSIPFEERGSFKLQ
jgi:LEA14-like dessication related protein